MLTAPTPAVELFDDIVSYTPHHREAVNLDLAKVSGSQRSWTGSAAEYRAMSSVVASAALPASPASAVAQLRTVARLATMVVRVCSGTYVCGRGRDPGMHARGPGSDSLRRRRRCGATRSCGRSCSTPCSRSANPAAWSARSCA